jgi:acetyl esterase/lipase
MMKRLHVGVIALAMTAIWAVRALSAEATKEPGTIKLRGGEGVRVLRDIPYVENGHERNKLDLYLPDLPEKIAKPLPIVVWIHGGGWQQGSKWWCPMLWLVPKGYAVVSINYRLSQHAAFPAQIHDCKAAIRWLRANAKKYHLDADHIGVAGASAGGHLVNLLGLTANVKEFEGAGGNAEQSSRVQAVIDMCGPSDFVGLAKTAKHPERVAALLGETKESVFGNTEKLRRVSPLTYVGRDAAPFLIMQGDKDELVVPEHARRLAAALKSVGVEVQLDMIPGAGHGGPQFITPEKRKLMEDFLAKHLKPTTTADDKKSGASVHSPESSRHTPCAVTSIDAVSSGRHSESACYDGMIRTQ